MISPGSSPSTSQASASVALSSNARRRVCAAKGILAGTGTQVAGRPVVGGR